MFETILAFSLGILFVAGVALYFTVGREKLNQQAVIQGLLLLRINIERVYRSEIFDGLSNETLLSGNLVPEGLMKGGNIMSSWGDIVVLPEVTGFEAGKYSITLYGLPRSVCMALVSNIDSWDSVYAGNESTKVFERRAPGEISRADRFAACQYEAGNVVKFVGP